MLTQELPFQRNACTAGSKYLYLIVHPWECIPGSTPTTLLQSSDTHRQAPTGPLCSACAAQGGEDGWVRTKEAMARSSSQPGSGSSSTALRRRGQGHACHQRMTEVGCPLAWGRGRLQGEISSSPGFHEVAMIGVAA